jgi:hypothetical protein
MFILRPSRKLSADQINKGLSLVIADGITAEAMVVFTSGTFLTAMAIQLGATNFQLGVFAALPYFYHHFSVIFNLAGSQGSIIAASSQLCSICWRGCPSLPSVAIPFLFTGGTTIEMLLILLFFQHIFGDIAGASWNSWMKDLVPVGQTGSFLFAANPACRRH